MARNPDARGPKRRQLEGSAHGAEVVRSSFAQTLTRRRYCELVGIHPTTLRRWEQAGVVSPALDEVLNIRTWVFSEDDIAFGRRLIALLREHPGELSLAEAAATARQSTPPQARKPKR